MNVGLTYDLRDVYLAEGYGQEQVAEFDGIETIDAIESALRSLGCHCVRIGRIQELAERLVRGERWDLVFNIAEGLNGIGREAQVPSILDAYQVPYTFSDPLVLALTMHKGMTKRAVRDLRIATADFAIVECPEDISQIRLPFPLFAKPIAEGTSKGITSRSKIQSYDELTRCCGELLSKFRQPVLVETFLPGRELTVGIVGTGRDARAIGVMEIFLQPNADAEVYTFANKSDYKTRVRYELVQDDLGQEATVMALRGWRGLGCQDAGRVDMRCDAHGALNFMEVNPLAGLNPDHSDLPILCSLVGIKYGELIRMILESAIRRIR